MLAADLSEVFLGAEVDLECHICFEAPGALQIADSLAELLICPAYDLAIRLTASCERDRAWVRRIGTNVGLVVNVLCHPLAYKVIGGLAHGIFLNVWMDVNFGDPESYDLAPPVIPV